MNDPRPDPGAPASSRRAAWLAAALLVLAGVAVYADGLGGPFVFDDLFSIPLNGTIRHFATAFSPPGNGTTVSGRPLLNLSFALNYAISGDRVWSYHLLNLLIHLLAGLVLFGLVRRTLELRSAGSGRPAEALAKAVDPALQLSPTALAFCVALLWLVHPLQTESVTYLVQRSESLMGLFYLLTLYGFVRGATGGRAVVWAPMSVAACLLGVGTKEVVVSAPLMALLYDRTFLAGSFREAWRRRRWWFFGLAATWLPLAWLVWSGGDRGGTAGFGVSVGFWKYAATQFEAITRYLALSVWPHPLIVDYGMHWVTSVPDVVPDAVVVALVAGGTAVALWRRPVLGFLGGWFLAILAPTSLVPGIRQTIVEHRMYLALAPLVVLLVLGLHALAGRRAARVLLALAVAAGWLTARRNRDYRSDLALWGDTVAKHPANAGPHLSLGDALFDRGHIDAALAQFQEAQRLEPANADAYYNAANALLHLGRVNEAIGHFQAALALRPDYFDAHNNLGGAFMQAGRYPEAVREFTAAAVLEPDLPEAYYNLGNALTRAGRLPAATRELRRALQLRPDYGEAHNNLGNLLLRDGELPAAEAQYEAAVRVAPDNVEAHANLGSLLWKLQRPQEAAAQYEQVQRLQPESIEAARNLGTIYLHLNRLPEAAAQFERVLRRQPGNAASHRDLGIIFGRTGRYREAVDQLQAALRLNPHDPLSHYNLGAALSGLGRDAEAKLEFEATLRLQPDFAPARKALARAESPPETRP